MTTTETASSDGRSPDMVADVLEFHRKFSLAYEGPPRTLPESLREFRVGFLEEECREYADAARYMAEVLSNGHGDHPLLVDVLADQLDALVDLVYVAIGNAVMQGFVTGRGAHDIFNEAWRRVHQANMAKVRAASDGGDSRRGNAADVVKPPGWRAPDHSDLVTDHAHRRAP